MYATLDHIEIVTPSIKTLWFAPERPVRYVAGQFTELFLPHENADDRGHRRWFTLSSSPTEPLLGITTRFDSTASSSFKRQLAALTPGARLHLADPMGDFVLPKDPSIPLVFVAGGLGITPVRSMIKWLHDTHETRNIHLLQIASTASELAFQELFSNYPLILASLVKGRDRQIVDAEWIADLARESAFIYLSGPEKMVESLYKELKTKGIDPRRLIGDYFPGY